MKAALLFLSLLIVYKTSAQQYILPNEQLVFSFKTENNKMAVLAKDKGDAYLVYRYGTKDKIEMEYGGQKGDYKKFTYSFYLRGGGMANEGMDMNYVSFNNNGYQYVLYDTYYAIGNKKSIGIKVINTAVKKTTDIKGIYSTRKGTMIDFRDSDLINKGDDMFD